MAKRFVIPFAASGDKTATPDATTGDGSISYAQGWGAQYQLPNSDPNYRPVGRQEMNGVLNDVTGALAELQTQGLPTWVAVTGLVQPYAINALVRYQGLNYRSAIANNSSTPGANTDWVPTDAPAGRRLARQVFSTAGTFPITLNPLTKFVKILVVGAGGAGSYTDATSSVQIAVGAGGGGGAHAVWEGLASALVGLSAIVGSGGVSPSSLNGGASSVGTLASANGGIGAGAAQAINNTNIGSALTMPGAGGEVVAGQAGSGRGGDGEVGIYAQTGFSKGGGGGRSVMGAGAGFVTASAQNAGRTATTPGGGGGGAATNISKPSTLGGSGAPGLVIIEEYT